MASRIAITWICCVVLSPLFCRADIEPQMAAANSALRRVMPDSEKMLSEGRLDEANQKILSTFPEISRTAVQSLMLGNVLFSQDPKTSYALHKRAAAELVDEPDVQLEWGMEQHRAKEYAGAVAAYSKFVEKNPQRAPVLGLMAECLIRTDKAREAVVTWQRSETAKAGTLVQFESLVCEVNSHRFPHRERTDLLLKVNSGDIDAAEALIWLDCNFERDWWNSGPQKTLLTNDVSLLRKLKFADRKRLDEILGAADCALRDDAAKAALISLLRARGFLFDAGSTLPQSGRMLSVMMGIALAADAIPIRDARAKWGTAILNKAKAAKDPEMFNVAARLYIGTDQIADIDQAGWDATGDERFAASLIVALMAKNALTLEDQRLIKAVKQYPENSQIAAVVVAMTAKAGKPMQPALIQAIKAEYTKFSMNHGIIPRLSATALRAYFAALSEELAKSGARQID